MNRPMICTTMLALACLLSQVRGQAVRPFESGVKPTVNNKIDTLVFARLDELGIKPANLCSDPVFLRRVYLDVTGTLPTIKETRQFLADKSPDKRSKLIDALLDRDEFADYWAMKWSEVLRVKAEFPINLWPNAVQTYYRWIRTAIKTNMPYDQFARELLLANGSNFRVPQVNFYRAMPSRDPNGIAHAVALTFMGVRIDRWNAQKTEGLAGFFSQVAYKSTGEWKEEIVYFDPSKKATDAVLPDGTKVTIRPGVDGRKVFTDWLVTADNPWFTANIANRIWFWLMGRGIVQEPDDMRPDNPPVNPKLLAYLQSEVVAGKYDLKSLYRLILNSSTYQLSCIPASDNPKAAANFASYPLRRLEAEVLIDAFNEITGTTESYTSEIPEPFTFIPPDQRAVQIADGSITSSFLELFGRPPRDTGMQDERSNRPTAAQRLHLLNSTHIRKKLEQGPKIRALLRSRLNMNQLINTIYLTILSRYPTQDEVKTIEDFIPPNGRNRSQYLQDVVWALVNSAEFLYRH